MKKIYLVSATICLLFLNVSCEDEPTNVKVDPERFKPVSTEILEGIKKISDHGMINDEAVCVEFVYPFTMITFDDDYDLLGSHEITGSDQLIAFLENIQEGVNISFSYPLSAVLPNGDVFFISNNEELIIALNECTLEDIIAAYNTESATAEQCVWNIPYSESAFDNTYAGGYFIASETGGIVFSHQNTNYTGTWTHLFIDSELYLNIFLVGNTSVSEYWNKNYKVVSNAGSKIINFGYDIKLNYSCGFSGNFTVGQSGPLNGLVTYAKESYSDGWKYIEIAGEDLAQEEWGCSNASIILANNDEIGTGLMNSIAITNYHDGINYSVNPALCSNLNNGTVTSKTALLSIAPAQKNWFLPSIAELQLMYTNLHLNGQGNFANAIYWSSTQASTSKAYGIDFSNGTVVQIPKSSSITKTRKIIYL